MVASSHLAMVLLVGAEPTIERPGHVHERAESARGRRQLSSGRTAADRAVYAPSRTREALLGLPNRHHVLEMDVHVPVTTLKLK
jgi:hypothetical protein